MGLGAMANAVVNLESDNMSAPLLARSFGTLLFACISAVAFATVLGTVSGLIIAASGAVAHDLMDRFLDLDMDNRQLVVAGKVAAILVGLVAIILGIIFKGVNVSFLVGWAFAVAAAANLPAIIMLLFWKRTTSQGIAASIVVGITVSLGIILLSPTMFTRYGLAPEDALIPLDNPGIVAIPLSFLTCWLVSLMTHGQPKSGGRGGVGSIGLRDLESILDKRGRRRFRAALFDCDLLNIVLTVVRSRNGAESAHLIPPTGSPVPTYRPSNCAFLASNSSWVIRPCSLSLPSRSS